MTTSLEHSQRDDEELGRAFASFLSGPRAGVIAERAAPTSELKCIPGPPGPAGPPGPPGPAAKPSAWVFTIERDSTTGFMTRVTAKPA